MQTAESEWVPIAEAARQLGVSIDTVRRRIKRDEIVAERRETPQGFVWWVCLDGPAEVGSAAAYADAEMGADPPTQTAQVGTLPPKRQQSEAPHLAALVRELQVEVLRRTEAATAWQVRAEVLAHQLAAAEEKIKALEAPKPDPEAEPTPDPFPQPLPPNSDTAPWWRRWLPWLASAGLVLAVGGSSCRPW